MNKLKAIASIIFAFLIYNFILFYIGWNGYVWLKSLQILDYPILYIACIILIGYSYLISHFTHFFLFKVVGSYWLAIIQYGILLLPIANLVCYLLNPFIAATEIIGSITFFILLFILIYGSYNAYSPVVRNYKLSISKKHAKRSSLKIAMASDMHFGTLFREEAFKSLSEQNKRFTA